MSSRAKKMIRISTLLVLLPALLGSYWFSKKQQEPEEPEKDSQDRFSLVKRGDFSISVELDGNMEAIERHLIKPEPGSGRYGLEIVDLIEDKTAVKKGDVLFRFSDEKHQQRQDELLLLLDDERTSLMLAEEDLGMTRAGNLSSIKAAADHLRAAKESLERYENQDAVREKEELRDALNAARDKVKSAQDAVTAARNDLTDAYMDDTSKIPELERKVETAEKNVESAEDALRTAHADLRVFKQYDHPQKMRSLTEALAEGQIGMQKVLVEAAGRVIQSERRIQNHKTRLRQLEEELEQLIVIRGQLVLTAPVDGIVSIGNPYRRRWADPDEFRVGREVRDGHTLASIPDLSRFVVNVDIPEELRSRLTIGQKAVLRSKAIPDLVIGGTLKNIDPMARNVVRWDDSSPKVYGAELSADSGDERLMPGMTIRVEIVVEQVTDALFVPLEAVYNREGIKYCRVRTLTGLEERQVETGRTSTSFVEIVSGLELGEKVALHQPGMPE